MNYELMSRFFVVRAFFFSLRSTIIIFYFNPVVGYLHMVGMTYLSSNLACSVTRYFLSRVSVSRLRWCCVVTCLSALLLMCSGGVGFSETMQL